MPYLFIEAKWRIDSLHSCGKALLNTYLPKHVPCVAVTCVATLCMVILHMAYHTANYMTHRCSTPHKNVVHADT